MGWIPAFTGVLILCASALAQDTPPIRNVTPPGMTPGPEVDGPLVREPVPPRPPDPPRWRRFFLPVTNDSATFVAKGLTIHVAGVAPPAVDATCRLADGSDWPCGKMALYGLRKFLHGRAVECYFPPPGDAAIIVAPCRVGSIDVGRWLLANGWATPDDLATDRYRALSTAAHCKRLGLWRETQLPEDCPKS